MRFVRDGSMFGDAISLDQMGGENGWMVSKGRGASLGRGGLLAVLQHADA